MYADIYNKKNRTHRSKKVVPGKCVFPFKYKRKEYNECLDTGNGPWCPTNLTKTGTVKTWGYCVDKDIGNAANILISMKKSRKQTDSKNSNTRYFLAKHNSNQIKTDALQLKKRIKNLKKRTNKFKGGSLLNPNGGSCPKSYGTTQYGRGKSRIPTQGEYQKSASEMKDHLSGKSCPVKKCPLVMALKELDLLIKTFTDKKNEIKKSKHPKKTELLKLYKTKIDNLIRAKRGGELKNKTISKWKGKCVRDGSKSSRKYYCGHTYAYIKKLKNDLKAVR